MLKYCFTFLFFCFISLSHAQKNPLKVKSEAPITNRLESLDSIKDSGLLTVEYDKKAVYTDYKIFSYKGDTTYVDSTLTLKKDYKFNYIRKDDFELLPFHNQGQTFTSLGYDFDAVSLYPALGAKAKHFNYYEIEDIFYYEVPTPTTELMWRTGLEQGQVLDALITLNTTKRHNITLAYKGMRSLGKYRNTLVSHGNMRLIYSYKSKNDRYQMKTHIVAQDLLNNENGGLTATSIENFENDDPDFTDRGKLETNFTNARNLLRGNRYFLAHDYKIYGKKDSLNTTKSDLKVGHVFNYEVKHYEYRQDASSSIFGDAYTNSITDKNGLTTLYNQVFVNFKSPYLLGNFKVFAENYDYDYRYNNLVILDNNEIIPQSLSSNLSSLGAEWKAKWRNIHLNARLASTVNGNLNGNYFKVTGMYKKDSLLTFKASILNNTKSPDFNFLLNQSNYKAYNWFNSDFKDVHTRSLHLELISEKLLDASVQLTQIDNYTYFGEALIGEQTKPQQYSGTVNYLKAKVSKSITYKKFTLDNSIMYQNVTNGEAVFRVPNLVTRNSIYYSNHVFKKKPLYIQTGFTFKYFTKYFVDAYNPLISEFHLQNQTEIGNFPVIDFFINARISQTRIYLKAEHFNSLFSPKDYYSAPNYPYRDFVVRFGLVWNFFI
jgi:hypothetical protein